LVLNDIKSEDTEELQNLIKKELQVQKLEILEFKTDKYEQCVLRTCLPDYSFSNSLSNGASFTATVPADVSYIESAGNAGKSFRAFRTDF